LVQVYPAIKPRLDTPGSQLKLTARISRELE